VLAVVAILSMTLSTVAVARLAYHLIGDFRSFVEIGSGASSIAPSRQRQSFLLGMMIPMLMVGVFAEFVLDWAGKSLGFILW
jgi:1,4-dihydroxy-2-naphthoate octaprenyltransferase